MFIWTPEALAQLETLRSKGLSQQKCARIIGCSDAAVFKALHPKPKPEPKPKPKPAPKIQSTKPLLNLDRHFSCPIRKKFNLTYAVPQLTKAQMYYDLARAVRNTAQLKGVHH
jgi:hypothetical protein